MLYLFRRAVTKTMILVGLGLTYEGPVGREIGRRGRSTATQARLLAGSSHWPNNRSVQRFKVTTRGSRRNCSIRDFLHPNVEVACFPVHLWMRCAVWLSGTLNLSGFPSPDPCLPSRPRQAPSALHQPKTRCGALSPTAVYPSPTLQQMEAIPFTH